MTRTFPSLLLVLLGAAVLAGPAAAGDDPSSFDALRAKARERAAREYVPPRTDDLPAWLADLDYDGYRSLRLRPGAALWIDEDLGYSLKLFHRGYLFRERTPISIDEGTRTHELAFDARRFDYGKDPAPELPETLGYSGFAIRHWRGREESEREIAAFQGASYFRLLADGQVYGASARAIAIDTAGPGPEEFPRFAELEVEKPAARAKSIAVLALLDGPSVTGAFRFVITPGRELSCEVRASLFPRKTVHALGIAPLTSMFLFGETRLRDVADWRPEVHDSDGLLIEGPRGEWTWRPVGNPAGSPRVTRIPVAPLQGFGLLQRDRDFSHYEDLESRYDLRPSFWIAPVGDWGEGAIELVELPSDAESRDNVVAAWVPARSCGKGDEIEVRYVISAYSDDASRPPLARASQVRLGRGKEARKLVIDFAGAGLEGRAADLRAEIAAGSAPVRNFVLQENEAKGGKRCSFDLGATDSEPAEIRVRLLAGERPVSEQLVLPWGKP